MSDEKPEGAVMIFVMGLLGLLVCAILGIVAWAMGNSYMEKCRAAGVQPEGLAVAGRILGIIATVLLIVTVVGGILMLILGGGMAIMQQ